MKKLIKSYSFWTALAGVLGIVIVNICKAFGVTISASYIEEIVMGICGVLVAVGIVKIPTKKDQKQNAKTLEQTNPEQDDN